MICSMEKAVRFVVRPINDILSPAVVYISAHGQPAIVALHPCVGSIERQLPCFLSFQVRTTALHAGLVIEVGPRRHAQ